MTANTMLIWCGDSWTFGSNLTEENVNCKDYRFASVTNAALDVVGINLSRPGSSISHLVYKIDQIKRIRNNHPDKHILVLFGLTVPYRLCIETEYGEPKTLSVNDFDIHGYKNWANNMFNDVYALKETCLTISWIAEQCRKNKLDFKFYNILCNNNDFSKSRFSRYLDSSDWLVNEYWSTYSELFGIDNLNFSKVSVLEKTSHGKKCLSQYFLSDGHPNIEGHKRIANRLVPEIKKLLKGNE